MLFDARELLPPDPFVRTLELLERLEGGRWVRLLLYRVPWPLFEAIEPDGWTHREYVHDDGTVRLPCAIVCKVENGRITRLDEYFDSAHVAEFRKFANA